MTDSHLLNHPPNLGQKIAFHGRSNDERIRENLRKELRCQDELLRLLEIRVLELEKSDRGFSVSIKVKK